MRETTLIHHMCENKKRWLNRDEKYVKMGFIVYKKFYDMNYRSKKSIEYGDFMKSKHYNAFVHFGKYLLDINAINPEAFVEFLLRAQVPLGNWEKGFVYEQYIRELNKREPAESAVERNVLLMQQWEQDSGYPWYDFFRKVNPNMATHYIRSGRLSPWVLYTAATSNELFQRFTDEQLKLIEQYVDPRFWNRKFQEQPDDVEFIKTLLSDAGL